MDDRSLKDIFIDIHRTVKAAERDEVENLETKIDASVDLRAKVDSLKERYLLERWEL